jgi:hypothetical protein
MDLQQIGWPMRSLVYGLVPALLLWVLLGFATVWLFGALRGLLSA